jgi:hypothetical protein
MEAEMLTTFGSLAVGVMLLAYWLELRSKWWVLLFSLASAATSAYSALAEVYPITVIEGLWTFIALHRFRRRYQHESVSS